MKQYIIKKQDIASLDINGGGWETVAPLQIDCFPWPGYDESVHTSVKIVNTGRGLLVRFETDEQHLLAEKTQPHTFVCQDSCMEFFFRTPNTMQYINLEINPIGTIYADFDQKPLAVDARMLNLVSQIGGGVWLLQYEVPFSLMETCFCEIGNSLCANFYKCGDHTDHPHYACWNPLDVTNFSFHQPQYFGELILE